MNWEEDLEKLEGWSFGDSDEMADQLGQLVLIGKKTATSSLLKFYEDDKEPLPQVGAHSYIKDSKGHPLCIVEVTHVELIPFKDVDEKFAKAEGEGDLSLEYWRSEHRSFFRKYCPDFREAMEVVCQRFKVLHRFSLTE